MITTFATSQMHKQKHLPATNSQNRTFFLKSAKRKCFFEIFDSQNLTKVSEKVHDFRYFSV
jgi:hypothetical protein